MGNAGVPLNTGTSICDEYVEVMGYIRWSLNVPQAFIHPFTASHFTLLCKPRWLWIFGPREGFTEVILYDYPTKRPLQVN